MKTAFLLRGLAGLFVALIGSASLLAALWVGMCITMSERERSLMVNVPGSSTTALGSSTGSEFVLVFAAFFALGLGMVVMGIYQLRLTFIRFDEESKVRALPIEDRLDELERLKRRDLVTPEEYAAKRAEILKEL